MFAVPKLLALMATLFATLFVGVDASSRPTRRMEQTSTSRIIPQHPGSSSKIDEKKQHPGWVREQIHKAAASTGCERCTKEEIIHECVVNYTWGLVGAF